MKRLSTLLSAICLLAISISAQQPGVARMAFFEESTNASCGPCASQNPAFDAQMDANEAVAIVLKYQWYFPGFDPMHNDNPDEANTRTAYYGINGVPTVAVNGEVPGDAYCGGCGGWNVGGGGYAGGPYGYNQAVIDYASQMPAGVSFAITAEVADGMMEVSGTVTAEMDISGDNRLRVAIAEREIDFGSAPGTNGESVFYHVMKAFMGGTNGTAMPDMMMGETFDFDLSFPMGTLNVYDYTQLKIVAFVQDDDTKEVHNATQVDDIEITTSFANNVGAADIEGLPAEICIGEQTISPVVNIVNGGNELLESADIVYSINGGPEQTTAWSGSLTTLGSEAVTLDPYSFTAVSTNTLEVTVQNPNGVQDENDADDVSTADIALAPEGDNMLTLTLQLDNWPGETSWEFRNEGGAVIASGDNYSTPDELVIEEIDAPLGCNTFTIFDDFGDGLNASQWGGFADGFFEIEDSQGNLLLSGGGEDNFDEVTSIAQVTSVTGLSELSLNNSFSAFPNPATDILTVQYDFAAGEMVTIQLVNGIGQVVMTRAIVSNGVDMEQFDVSSLDAGIYHLNTFVADAYGSKTISIVK